MEVSMCLLNRDDLLCIYSFVGMKALPDAFSM